MVSSYLSLPSNRCHFTDFLCSESVNYRTLSNIGVANETNADLTLVYMQLKLKIEVQSSPFIQGSYRQDSVLKDFSRTS